MLTFSTLELTLALSTQVSAKDFPDKPYSLKTKGTTTQAKGFKVSREAPMKIKLKSNGLTLEKSKLGQKDVVNKKGDFSQFNVSFGAPASGSQSVAANAVFFICNENICQRKVEKLEVAVNVKP